MRNKSVSLWKMDIFLPKWCTENGSWCEIIWLIKWQRLHHWKYQHIIKLKSLKISTLPKVCTTENINTSKGYIITNVYHVIIFNALKYFAKDHVIKSHRIHTFPPCAMRQAIHSLCFIHQCTSAQLIVRPQSPGLMRPINHQQHKLKVSEKYPRVIGAHPAWPIGHNTHNNDPTATQEDWVGLLTRNCPTSWIYYKLLFC